MTSRFNVRNLVLCLSLSVFFSCKKDDNPTPTPPPAQPSLFEQVQGRWNATFQAPPRISNPSVSSKQQDMGYITSVEIFSDSSYILVLDEYRAYTGKISVTDTAAVNFRGFGSTSNLKISGDSISFTCLYEDEYPIEVKAVKANDLTISTDNKALLKSWLVTKEEDGGHLYAMFEISDEATLSFYFSAAGTFLLKSNQMGNYAMFRNWKWHPEHANAIQMYTTYNASEPGTYFKIVSITNSKLVIKEYGTMDGEPQQERTYVLTAQ